MSQMSGGGQMTRFAERYQKTATPELVKEFGYTNPHQVPRITKVVVNAGVGRAGQTSGADPKLLEAAQQTLTVITGQHPVVRTATKSIAGFKIRTGSKVGTSVTLRGARRDDFLDLLVSVVLPRIRDFRGISATAFDPQGNYSLGLSEQTVFPQIGFDETGVVHGLQINVVTTAQNPVEAKRLLELMGFPLKKEEA